MVMTMGICAAAVILFILWMRHELDCLETTYYTVESERIPDEFDGTRFVLLSDLHGKSFGAHNGRLLAAIARQKPDFIVAAGDLVTAGKKDGEKAAKELMEVLGKQYDVFYGRGNHEERLSETDRGFEDGLRRCGVHYLHNESVFLVRGESRIRITGLSLPMEYFEKFHQTPLDAETVEGLIGNKKDNIFNLLIAHKPAHFFQYASWGADLIVSGHLHGGMIRLPFLGGVISPQLEIFPKFDAGKFILGKSTMIISRGLGSHSIPIRIHNRPELVVVNLTASKKSPAS